MAITSADLLDYLYYRCLPGIYQEEDANIGKPLYRYLQSIILGGYDLAIQDIDNIIKLVNPETCPEQFFPILYESFGLTYYPDVDMKYHRKFLMNYGELRRRKGTYSCIRFLVRVLTNMDVKLSYKRGIYNHVNGRHLILKLQAATIEDINNINTDTALVQKFLGFFLPYYITTTVEGEVATSVITSNRYRSNVITTYSSYVISPLFEHQEFILSDGNVLYTSNGEEFCVKCIGGE